MRRGDELHVTHLAELGKSVVEVLGVVETIHSRGAIVVETSTERRSDRDMIAMLKEAMPKLSKGLTKRAAKKNGSKGGRPPNDKMPEKEAKAIWHDARIKTNAEALKRMTGWYYKLAWDKFGGSGREKVGRPKRKTK